MTTIIVTLTLLLGAAGIYFCWLSAYDTRVLTPHVFLDLETLGLAETSQILSIAAVIVDQNGRELSAQMWLIDQERGPVGTTDLATAEWWDNQPEEARELAFSAGNRVTLKDALVGLSRFMRGYDAVYVWGNSPTFDCKILRHAYGRVALDAPWEWWLERDVRTVAWIGEMLGYDAKSNTPFAGTRHNPLDDARHQARYTTAILRRIKRGF